jgi:protein NrfC
MDIKELEKLQSEDLNALTSKERRTFLKAGLAITGLFMGGTVLSLTAAREAQAVLGNQPGERIPNCPYGPHYSMLFIQNRCIDCERCKVACAEVNDVPEYGYRTTILERYKQTGPDETVRIFMPVLCNHCNRPPCVRVCPTRATFKDKKTGIVLMDTKKCIGCKTCMAACPYNARYFHEEIRAIDKCTFCFDTKLKESGGKTTACVEACPAHVRIFGDLHDTDSELYQLVYRNDTVVWVLRPESGALPNVFYMNDQETGGETA